MKRLRAARSLLVFCLVLALVGCPQRFLAPVGEPGGAQPQGQSVAPVADLWGRVDLGAFTTQGTGIDEIASGATVALIDSETGYTLASSVTTTTGAFRLTFSNGFRPAAGRVYYLEALKGLMAGSDVPNRIGAPLARIRSLVAYRAGSWNSVAAIPGAGVSVTPVTTALSIVAGLRAGAGQAVPLIDLIPSLQSADDPETFTQTAKTGITIAALKQATELVEVSLALDQDPVRSILLDVSAPDLGSFVLAKSPFTISYFSPPSVAIGETVEVVGDNFDPLADRNQVTFTGSGGIRLPAPVLSVSPDRARLAVKVPAGATSGPVSVQVGDLLLMSTVSFQLAARDGHSVIDAQGNLYAANYDFGTISRITSDGVILPLASGLNHPRGLTLGPDNRLYVADGDGTIHRIDPAMPAKANWTTYATGAVGAWGLAFSPSGVLYLSLEDTDRIVKVVSGALQPVTATGLKNPRGLSFGPDPLTPGRYLLYVANFGNDTVSMVDPDSGTTTLYKSGFSRPWSLAFDTFGTMYVTNNAGNSVFRVGTDGVVTPFASVQNPGGLDADPTGYLYVADNASNRIYRIDTNGYSTLFSEGVSYPKGLAAASNGTFYVANAANNSVIRVAPDGSVATIARGLNDPSGVALDEARGHLYVSNAGSGTIVRVVLADGSFSTVVRNLVLPSGLAYLKNRLYVYLPDSRDGATVYKNLSELWAFDVTDPAFSRTRVIRTPLRGNRGVATHPSGTGTVYVAQPEENYVAKIESTGVMSRFVATAPSPEDVAVDALGRLYVACRGTDASDQAIQVFGADGALLGTITDKIDRPISLAYDPDTQDVFVGNGATGAAGSGSIKRIKTADWTVSDVLGAVTNPTGIAFNGADMCLISGGNAYRVDSYKTAPVLITPKVVARNNLLDLELSPDGTLYAIDGSSLWRYPRDDQGKYPAEYRQSYNFVGGGARLAPISTTGVYFTTPGGGVYSHTFGGSTPARWAGLFNLFGGTMGGFVTCAIAAGTYQGQDYLYVTSSQYAGYCGLARINLDPAVSEVRHVFDSSESRGPHGVGFDPATGKAWSIGASMARVLRFDTPYTKIERSLLDTDPSYIGYGGACWNGDFYATIHTQHRLEKFSGASTITRTLVPTGLGGPEI